MWPSDRCSFSHIALNAHSFDIQVGPTWNSAQNYCIRDFGEFVQHYPRNHESLCKEADTTLYYGMVYLKINANLNVINEVECKFRFTFQTPHLSADAPHELSL